MDDADPLTSVDKLKSVGVLTKLANESASIAVNLLAANKDTVKQLSGREDDDDNGAPAFNVTVSS